MRQTHWGRTAKKKKRSRIWTEPVAACAYEPTHTSSVWVCKKSVFVLVNDAQWMWWERNMVQLQVCLLFIQWEWMRLTGIHSNNTPARDTHRSSHQSFPLSADGSMLLQSSFYNWVNYTLPGKIQLECFFEWLTHMMSIYFFLSRKYDNSLTFTILNYSLNNCTSGTLGVSLCVYLIY